MLALPHAYAELKAHGRAALLYGHALETFSGEIEQGRRLDRARSAKAGS